jgi:hypothetical protein
MASFEFTGTYTIILEADSAEEAKQEAEETLGNTVWSFTIEEV